MSYILFPSHTFPKSIWSGGTTTQLFIYPENTDFQSRNFDFRISTATVEVEESTFTKFNGYLRKLVVLEGELIIEHENQYTKKLKSFQQDSFSGEWNTKGYGKVVDFNVIYRKQFDPKIEAINLETGQTIIKDFTKQTFIYLLTGEIQVFNIQVTAGSGMYVMDELPSVISTEQQASFIFVEFT